MVVVALVSIFVFTGCANNEQSNDATDTNEGNTPTVDTVDYRISFGKKYYSLGQSSYTENEYYTFNDDGTATYTHIMKDGDTITYHQVLNFKWTYAGESEYILIHNGTQMLKGTQDEANGFGRVMHVSSNVIYWSSSGENSYFINEDYVGQIEQYGMIVEND